MIAKFCVRHIFRCNFGNGLATVETAIFSPFPSVSPGRSSRWNLWIFFQCLFAPSGYKFCALSKGRSILRSQRRSFPGSEGGRPGMQSCGAGREVQPLEDRFLCKLGWSVSASSHPSWCMWMWIAIWNERYLAPQSGEAGNDLLFPAHDLGEEHTVIFGRYMECLTDDFIITHI